MKASGWKALASKHGKMETIVWEPSEWETILAKLAIPEDKALSIVTEKGDMAKMLRMWIRQNYLRRFVPEKILEALNIARYS
jgi:intergrase/recombinase